MYLKISKTVELENTSIGLFSNLLVAGRRDAKHLHEDSAYLPPY